MNFTHNFCNPLGTCARKVLTYWNGFVFNLLRVLSPLGKQVFVCWLGNLFDYASRSRIIERTASVPGRRLRAHNYLLAAVPEMPSRRSREVNDSLFTIPQVNLQSQWLPAFSWFRRIHNEAEHSLFIVREDRFAAIAWISHFNVLTFIGTDVNSSIAAKLRVVVVVGSLRL